MTFAIRCHAFRFAATALAFGLACGAASAANFSRSAHDGAKEDIKKTYKAEREACAAQSGNAKDVCLKQAKGRESVALAQLEFNYSGSVKDEKKLWDARFQSRYDVAKERCDDVAGDAKDLCLREAKTEHEKSKADVKMAAKMLDAAEEADRERMKAEYKLAKEKCDTLSGDPKDVCIASAKARYRE